MPTKRIAATDKNLPKLFGALSDSRRFGMFELLLEKKDICVSEIAALFHISVPAASQQLKVLEQAGLVERCREGQRTCYEVKRNDPVLKSIVAIINKNGRTLTI